MYKQLSFLGLGCLVALLALLSSCGVFEQEEFELLPVVDCPTLGLNFRDSCAAAGAMGTVNERCECITPNTFECSEFMGNAGDSCVTAFGIPGTIRVMDSLGICRCDTSPIQTYDCPALGVNFGRACRVSPGVEGRIDTSCNCVEREINEGCNLTQTEIDDCRASGGEIVNLQDSCICDVPDEVACPDLGADIGDFCFTVDSTDGIVNQDCECEEIAFDCPELQLNIGQRCQDAAGNFGEVAGDCSCAVPMNTFDCPDQQANFGDSCRTPNGEPGELDGNCNCFTGPGFDCPDLRANFNTFCVTVDSLFGVADSSCVCIAWDCQIIEQNIGDNCVTANGARGTVSDNCDCI